jgi:hypothetical protein
MPLELGNGGALVNVCFAAESHCGRRCQGLEGVIAAGA